MTLLHRLEFRKFLYQDRTVMFVILLFGFTTEAFFQYSLPKHCYQTQGRKYVDRNLFTSVSPKAKTKLCSSRGMDAKSKEEPIVVPEISSTPEHLNVVLGPADAKCSTNATSRKLGSQELLMLPRQYRPKETGIIFPPMIHLCAVTLNRTPSIPHLFSAIQNALDVHPLLSCRVEGDGEPNSRIDGLQMVRSGNPNPETFVVVNSFQAIDVGKVVTIPNDGNLTSLEDSWSRSFQYNIDRGYFNTSRGPLWSLEMHKFDNGDDSVASDQPCALLFSLNHAISDQSSVNMLIDQIIADIASFEATSTSTDENHYIPAVKNSLPLSVEECTLGKGQAFDDLGVSSSLISLDSFTYLLEKASEGLKNAPILPDNVKAGSDSVEIGSLDKATNPSESYFKRESMVVHRKLSTEVTNKLLKRCREQGVTLSNALTAAMAYTSSDFISGKNEGESTSWTKKVRTYKVLQSLDMRRFGVQPDPCETLGCHAGSHDLMLGLIPDFSGKTLRLTPTDSKLQEKFWNVARLGRDQTKMFIESNGPITAVRIFDFAMSFSDMNNLVHWTAQSRSSQGRAYSAGVTNAGVFEKQKSVMREGVQQRTALKTTHGRYAIEDIFFASSHAWSGSLYHVSLLTVNGELKLTFHPVFPIVSREASKHFADAYMGLLKAIAVENDGVKADVDETNWFFKDNIVGLTAAGAVFFGLAIHWDAWLHFISSLITMRENTPDVKDFWDALNFWIFFAVAHPILQPLLWISEVLHGSPGPMVANLVPITFLLGNVIFVGATLISKALRDVINVAAFSAFLMYVGAGLGGQAGLGDYNLQLDDSYKGQIVKGCPAYADMRQPSMEGFDLQKYQGRWYEQKFHDWTQFKEVYDTTLDIKLTADGTGWIDDFGVKGPAPKAAGLSWEKSPVANGAHYFLFGRVDPNDPPGVLREKGFNVEFPNYIVDVQRDPATGEYTEAIQFQCLERGGVRVFEGINFLSRSPEMTEDQLQAMHTRAATAGMNAYGASIDQMHRVERREVDAPEIDNSWQAMWRTIGVDKLLKLLAESIEDGGRDST